MHACMTDWTPAQSKALLKNEWMQGQQTDEQTKKGKNEHMADAEDYKS